MPSLARAVEATRYAYFGAPVPDGSGLQVIFAGRERCLPDYRMQRAGFPRYALEFVADGAGQVELDGRTFPLFPGVVFCYGKSTQQDIRTDPERPLTKYFVNFSGRGAAWNLRRAGLSPGCAVQVRDVEAVRFLFEQLVSRNDPSDPITPEYAAHCLSLIILSAIRGQPPSPEAAGVMQFSKWCAYIDENYARLHSLDQMAGELGTRPSQICRVFQTFGQPRPFQYLTRRKLNRAVELLVGQGMSVQGAALAVGYEDPYHFSRLFKQHFGHAPTKFLKIAGRMQTKRSG